MISDGCQAPRVVDFLHLPTTLPHQILTHPFFYCTLMNEVSCHSQGNSTPLINFLTNVLIHYLLHKYLLDFYSLLKIHVNTVL